jgi:diguanylate cyclase (GGDEF)-like protein
MDTEELIVEQSPPFGGFQEAAQAVLMHLHERLGFQLWMATRTEEDDWIVLSAEDHGYGVKGGDLFRWSDSFCSRMVRGLGPRIAPRSAEIPAYAEAPIGSQVPIQAYIGVPISRDDGSLFGTLCAVDPEPQPDAIQAELPAVELLGRLLATILSTELAAQDGLRRAERAAGPWQTDHATGFFNRSGWERIFSSEEERCRQYGSSAGVVSVLLPHLARITQEEGLAARDRLLARVAPALRRALRISDVVARPRDDEIVLLSTESRPGRVKELAARVREELASAGVRASVGWASRDPREGLLQALEAARAMVGLGGAEES